MAIEGARLGDSYGAVAIAYREARGGAPLVPEGGSRDPEVMDLEGRREALRSFLAGSGLADDLEFLPRSSEDRAICLVRSGRREMLGDRGWGVRRLVLIAATLLYLPWGSRVIVEDPESGLDSRLQGAMADLLRLLVRLTGAAIVAETRSAAFAEALGLSVAGGASAERSDPDGDAEGSLEAGPARRPAIGVCDSVDGMSRLIELGWKTR